jgi:hypothetical protein
MLGQCTVIGTGPTEGEPSLPDVADTELDTVPHVSPVVGEVMCTETLLPEANVTPLAPPQVRTPALMAHVPPHPADWLTIDQSRPPFDGSASVSFTLVAAPGPLFDTVMTYPMLWPALTVDASATFVIARDGQLTVIVTGPTEGEPSFPDVAEAEFETVPQVAAVVGDVM